MKAVRRRLARLVDRVLPGALCLLVAAVPTTVEAQSGAAAEALTVLDVPYIAQTPSLCGGAAAAMVLRYWGERDVWDRDFAHLVDPRTDGIPTGELVDELRRRGARVQVRERSSLRHLSAAVGDGRPPIVLLRVAPGVYHYVVVVSVPGDVVLVHDPADAPYRVLPRSDFLRRWAATRSWVAIVEWSGEPGSIDGEATAPVVPEVSLDGPCEPLFRAGVRLGEAGRLDAARTALEVAAHRCPGEAEPLRELAGLRFLENEFQEAAALALGAVRREPGDEHAWRILASARFLAGDDRGALTAWNRLGTPRIDRIEAPGLRTVRHPVLRKRLGLDPGSLLTPERLLLARRRLEALPVARRTALRYTPVDAGRAQLRASVVTRPGLELGLPLLARTGLDALVGRRFRLEVPGPTGSGELLQASWRWESGRPRVAVALESPDPAGVRGILRLEAEWEEQTYALDGTGLQRESRRRGGVSLRRWVDAETRVRAGVAVERWTDRPFDLVVSLGAERRLAADHGAVRIAGDLAVAPGASPGYGVASVGMRWRSSTDARTPGVFLDTGLVAVGEAAPRGRWPGAGTGRGREQLLRAHPLLADGALTGDAFGRRLLHASVEGRAYPLRVGPLPLGVAVFTDVARVWAGEGRADVGWLVDVGGGVRLGIPGSSSDLRVDAATGLRGGGFTLSLGWQESWD